MSFSYATDENSSFVVPPSRDYLLGRDESQHEIQNRTERRRIVRAGACRTLGSRAGNGAPDPRRCRCAGPLCELSLFGAEKQKGDQSCVAPCARLSGKRPTDRCRRPCASATLAHIEHAERWDLALDAASGALSRAKGA